MWGEQGSRKRGGGNMGRKVIGVGKQEVARRHVIESKGHVSWRVEPR
jgi:hypothetical protein